MSWSDMLRTMFRGKREGGKAPATFSRPALESGGRMMEQPFLPLPDETPFEMLGMYRRLRDTVPDVSDAVWTWKRLCHTGHDLAVSGPDAEEAKTANAELAARIQREAGGLAGLLDVFYASLFTYGAAAVEVVPGRAREGIHDIVPVDIWTVRFRRESGRLRAFQLHDGEEIALPDGRFLYVGLDRDGTNPYGRGMLRALPAALRIQQQLMNDMARATHNAGWSKLHVRYRPEERTPGESAEAYAERMRGNLRSLRDRLSGAAIDQNLVTYDNVEVAVLGGQQRQHVFYENHKAVEEQVITGMHMMPVLMGRNYGSTETYGTAQFEVVNRQVQTVNRHVAALLTRVYALELALRGLDACVAVTMRGNRTVDILKEATARGKEIDNALRMLDAQLIDREGAQQLLANAAHEGQR